MNIKSNSGNRDYREINELRTQIENFKKEKERVRSIIGQIGGMPTSQSRVFNIIFIVLVICCLIASLLSEGTVRLAIVEVAVALLSLKIIFLMHNQARVNHFQLWILTSIEWRLNELDAKQTLQEDYNALLDNPDNQGLDSETTLQCN